MKPWQQEAHDSHWTANEQPMRQITLILPTNNWDAYIHLQNACCITGFQ